MAVATAAQALETLRKALDAGVYATGARLPPERDLARRLGMGRGTLRKALDALAREGRITRHVGRGAFVTQAHGPFGLSAQPSPADVMEVRLMVEPAIAAAAALRARAGELEALGALLEPDADPAPDWRAWEARDDAFHSALAAASRNPLLGSLLETLHRMRRSEDWTRLRRGALDAQAQRANLRRHREIFEAVSRRDAAGAAAAMRAHLTDVDAAMRAGVDAALADPSPLPKEHA